MLSLSIKGKYALSAILELASQDKDEPVQSKSIAINCNIPQRYLEQLLLSLKKAGLVKSLRGSQGGYILEKPSSDILVYDILYAVEGEKSLTDDYCGCNTLHQFWNTVDTGFKTSLKVSIETLLENKQKEEEMLVYYI